jgi:rubredoxin
LKLAKYFSDITPEVQDDTIEDLSNSIMSDIDEQYVEIDKIAKAHQDRGTQRACVWGEKVTRMLNSLVNRYVDKGEEIFEDSEVWLCTICGFIFIGKNPPEKCPVCKVQSSKFEKIEGGKF